MSIETRRKVGDLMQLRAGTFSARTAGTKITSFYSLEDFQADLDFPAEDTNTLVFNLFRQLCTPQSARTKEKPVSTNFALAQVHDPSLDPLFFVSWFNYSRQAHQQILTLLQGSAVDRIGTRNLKELQIDLPDKTIQGSLGRLYAAQRKLSATQTHKSFLQQRLLKTILDQEER